MTRDRKMKNTALATAKKVGWASLLLALAILSAPPAPEVPESDPPTLSVIVQGSDTRIHVKDTAGVIRQLLVRSWRQIYN